LLEVEEYQRRAFEIAVILSETAKNHSDKIDGRIRQEQTFVQLMSMGEGDTDELHPYEDHLSQFGQLIAHAFGEVSYDSTDEKHADVTRATEYLQSMRGLYTKADDLHWFYEGFCKRFSTLPMPSWVDIKDQFAKRNT
jgi:hypothetical protein